MSCSPAGHVGKAWGSGRHFCHRGIVGSFARGYLRRTLSYQHFLAAAKRQSGVHNVANPSPNITLWGCDWCRRRKQTGGDLCRVRSLSNFVTSRCFRHVIGPTRRTLSIGRRRHPDLSTKRSPPPPPSKNQLHLATLSNNPTFPNSTPFKLQVLIPYRFFFLFYFIIFFPPFLGSN